MKTIKRLTKTSVKFSKSSKGQPSKESALGDVLTALLLPRLEKLQKLADQNKADSSTK